MNKKYKWNAHFKALTLAALVGLSGCKQTDSQLLSGIQKEFSDSLTEAGIEHRAYRDKNGNYIIEVTEDDLK